MKVVLRYFAAVRERLGVEREEVELPPNAVLADAVAAAEALHPQDLPAMRAHLRFALGVEFAPLDAALSDGAEVAFIPPVAGGAPSPRHYKVTEAPLHEATVVALADPRDGSMGAVSTFTGVVRHHTRGRSVVRLEYEAHAEMAEAVLARIGDECAERWPGTRVAIHHRVGVLDPGDLAVVIAAAAPHRAEAFAACRHAIERLKEDCPIWKKEVGPDGSEWVGMGP